MFSIRLFLSAKIILLVTAWLAPSVAGPIVYTFSGSGPGALNGDRYDDGYELRFQGDSNDIRNGDSIENLLGTIHLQDGRVGAINEPMTISLSRRIDTYSAVGFNPTGPDRIVSVNHMVQKEILLFPSELDPPPFATNGAENLILTTRFFSANPQEDLKRTFGYHLERDFELTGTANAWSIPTDFAGQSQSVQVGSMTFETTLGRFASSNFAPVTFRAALVPEPTDTLSLLLLVFASLCAVRRRRTNL